MDLILYQPLFHANIMKQWLKQRNLSEELAEQMPDNSYMAVSGHELIAVAGLDIGKTIAILMGMTTNPNSSFKKRSYAIDLLTQKISDRAKDLGYKVLFAWTDKRGILRRSFNHGFKSLSQIMIMKELGES